MADSPTLKRKRSLNDVLGARRVTKQCMDTALDQHDSILAHEVTDQSYSPLPVPQSHSVVELWPGSQFTPINRPAQKSPLTSIRVRDFQEPSSGSSIYSYTTDLDIVSDDGLYDKSSSPLPTRFVARQITRNMVIEAAERLVDTTQLVREQAQAEKEMEDRTKREERRVELVQKKEQKLAREEEKRQAIAANKAHALATGDTAGIAKWTLMEQKESEKVQKQLDKDAEMQRRREEREAQKVRKRQEVELLRALKKEERARVKSRTPPKDGLKKQKLSLFGIGPSKPRNR